MKTCLTSHQQLATGPASLLKKLARTATGDCFGRPLVRESRRPLRSCADLLGHKGFPSMRALFMTNEYPPHIYGGAGVHVEYLSRELAKLSGLRLARNSVCSWGHFSS